MSGARSGEYLMVRRVPGFNGAGGGFSGILADSHGEKLEQLWDNSSVRLKYGKAKIRRIREYFRLSLFIPANPLQHRTPGNRSPLILRLQSHPR
jgi:hypothetical protein